MENNYKFDPHIEFYNETSNSNIDNDSPIQTIKSYKKYQQLSDKRKKYFEQRARIKNKLAQNDREASYWKRRVEMDSSGSNKKMSREYFNNKQNSSYNNNNNYPRNANNYTRNNNKYTRNNDNYTRNRNNNYNDHYTRNNNDNYRRNNNDYNRHNQV